MGNIYSIQEARGGGILAGSACAFGVFDGVHRGHRLVIGRACAAAAEAAAGEGAFQARSVVLTFDIDPDELFRPDSLRKLMSDEARIAALAETGVDAVVVLPFTRDFAELNPQDFLAETFGCAGQDAPASLHVGSDVRFGARAAGDVRDLREWGARAGCVIDACDLLVDEGAPVTATRIRALLQQGAIGEANRLLGHLHAVSGVVEAGRGEGRDMGFRTANLNIPARLQVLGEGVYGGYAHVGGVRYKAAVSVGAAPTFAAATAACEVHILDFEGDIYGQPITVEFAAWLRPMMKFDSVQVLIETVMGNIDWVRRNL